ncbi:MAG: hypothetical protein K9W43_01680 [Candidatus Thorarchaeota archaeon]|nr:hypothetical protein [Candidatus Thorarchaeota archaeon]
MDEMRRRRKLRMHENEIALLDLFAHLDKKYPDLLIVVEGHRDEMFLRNAGVEADIIRIHSGKRIADVVKQIVDEAHNGKETLILTDFDEEGVALAYRIERLLEKEHIITLRRLRNHIGALMGNLRCIEEMVSILKKEEWRERE